MNSTDPSLDRKNVDSTDYVESIECVETVSATNDPPKFIKPKRLNNRTIRGSNKIGRNDKCPCGSGLKYKKCHLK